MNTWLRQQPASLLLAAVLMACTLWAPHLAAQDTNDENPPAQFPVWQATLPGGDYIVKVAAIDSISRHTYVVDGAVEVTEVVVSTPGASVVRFYSMRKAPIQSPSGVGQYVVESVEERAAQLAERFGAKELLDSTVVKSYPATTHAKTVEFRLGNAEDLDRLFSSLSRAWLTGRGGTFKLNNNSKQ